MRRWREIGAAFLLAGLGGVIFDYLGLPLPWMLGAITACTAATLSGVRIAMSNPLRTVMIAVLGTLLGSGFTPDIIDQAPRWMVTLCVLAVTVVLTVAIVMFYMRRVAGFDRPTAYFAATPGGLSEMTIVGASMGGDDRMISLVHTVRVTIVVFVIPFWFYLFEGYDAPAAMTNMATITETSRLDLALLAVCAVVGPFGAKLLRLPGAVLTGPMLLSATFHLTGLTETRPPMELLALAQLVIGASIGCRFSGISVRRILSTLIYGAGSTVIMLIVTTAIGYLVASITGEPRDAVLLAFSPGGLAEMTLVALAMGSDVAFITTHHLVRLMLVVAFAPIVFRLLDRFAGIDRRDAPPS